MHTINVTFVLNFQADNPPPTGPKIEKKANNDNIGMKSSKENNAKKKTSNYGSESKNVEMNKNENENDVTWIKNKIIIKKTTKFGCFDLKQKT